MTRFLSLLLLLATIVLPSCVTQRSHYYVGSDDYVLASRDLPDGGQEKFELIVGSAVGDAVLRVTTSRPRQRGFLGLQVKELDKGQAESRGVKPYSGLLVKNVTAKSPASAAGVMAGDILVSIDGKETVYLTQVSELELRLVADQNISAKVMRGQNELDLTLVAEMRREQVSESKDVALEAPSSHRPYAGVNLRGIPAEWSERIFGEKRNAVVVTNVEVGSPAWLAGVRGGDLIEKVDGVPAPTAEALARDIQQRGEQEQTMRWQVTRGRGESFDAELHLRDYSGETRFWFPLVFWLQNGARSDRWSVGPFGLLMSNRNEYVGDSRTRALKTRNVFSAVLGLFRVETGPDETEVRLLWFISFET